MFSAVVFGVGVGFKDGVGKASEFFAGYVGTPILLVLCKFFAWAVISSIFVTLFLFGVLSSGLRLCSKDGLPDMILAEGI